MVDQRTPVIVGVGQFAEHIDASDYRGMSSVELATAFAGSTLTGGPPFFGGPGNNYSTHAIAEAVHEMRDKPG